MPGWLGPWEIVIVIAVIVLLFGTRRLPTVGKSLGRGLREVKEATSISDPRTSLKELDPRTHVKRALTGETPSGERDSTNGDPPKP
jgi:sec-independent protein translocase protein TatA